MVVWTLTYNGTFPVNITSGGQEYNTINNNLSLNGDNGNITTPHPVAWTGDFLQINNILIYFTTDNQREIAPIFPGTK